VALKHPTRQVAADRLGHVIGDAEARQSADDGVAQIVDPEARQPRVVTQRSPGGVPLQRGLRPIEPAPPPRGQQLVLGHRQHNRASSELVRSRSAPVRATPRR
jgi:hypothetical protein